MPNTRRPWNRGEKLLLLAPLLVLAIFGACFASKAFWMRVFHGTPFVSPDGVPLSNLTLSRDGRVLAATGIGTGPTSQPVSGNGAVYVWNAGTGDLIRKTASKPFRTGKDWEGDRVDALSLSPNGDQVGVGWSGYQPVVNETRSGRRLSKLPVDPRAWSPDGQLIACGNGLTLRLVDAASFRVLRNIRPIHAAVGCVFSSDSKRLIASNDTGQLVVFDARDGKKLQTLPDKGTARLALSQDDTSLASITYSKGPSGSFNSSSIHFYDLASGKMRWEYQGETSSLKTSPQGLSIDKLFGSVAISPDNACVAVTTGSSTTLLLLDARNGQEITRYQQELVGFNSASGVAFSKDGKQVFACSGNTVRVHDISGLQPAIHDGASFRMVCRVR